MSYMDTSSQLFAILDDNHWPTRPELVIAIGLEAVTNLTPFITTPIITSAFSFAGSMIAQKVLTVATLVGCIVDILFPQVFSVPPSILRSAVPDAIFPSDSTASHSILHSLPVRWLASIGTSVIIYSLLAPLTATTALACGVN